MPALDKLRQQHDVLGAPRLEAAGLRLSAAFAQAAAPFRAARLLPPGVLDALERDLLYVLLRHLRWTSAPLFADVVVDCLATEYALERPVASALTHALLPGARRLDEASASHVEPTDAEFLRYVCVASATADSEAALVQDLGLGSNLLGRIKDAVRLLVADDDGRGARFLPEIDALIVETLAQLAREQQTVPWTLQVHRLRFLLGGIGEPWRGLLATHGARWAHELLLTLATRGNASVRQLAAKLAKLLPGTVDVDDAFTTALLEALAPFGLCYAERDRWHALPLAQELTAEAFARNRLNTPTPPWEDFAQLCAPFQAALVRCAPDCDDGRLMSLLLHTRPLAAPVLGAALGRLAETSGATRAADTVAKILQGESSPWLRKAACDALAALGVALPVGQTLSEVARSDPSSAVQSAALRAALRHGATTRQTDDAGGGATVGRAEAPTWLVDVEPGR